MRSSDIIVKGTTGKRHGSDCKRTELELLPFSGSVTGHLRYFYLPLKIAHEPLLLETLLTGLVLCPLLSADWYFP